jgi:predicted nucleic acid-binding protein
VTDRFVADASIAVAWVHPARGTAKSRKLLQAVHDGAAIEVPALWPVETANALLVLVRRHKLTEEERQEALGALAGLQAKVDHDMASLAFTKLSELAGTEQLSLYDATYLELALRSGLPLACKDGPLREAARRRKVTLL